MDTFNERPLDPKDIDRIDRDLARGLRGEQARPFIEPYLVSRTQNLIAALRGAVRKTGPPDAEKALEIAIRMDEIQMIYVELEYDEKKAREAKRQLGHNE